MSNVLKYKNYCTKIEYDSVNGVLYGKIEGIRDLVNFESDSLQKIVDEFHTAVDDYLDFCKEVGKEPDREYSGSFNVRISSELHRKASFMAMEEGKTLNRFVEEAIETHVLGRSKTEISLSETVATLSTALAAGHIAASTLLGTQHSFSTASAKRERSEKMIYS